MDGAAHDPGSYNRFIDESLFNERFGSAPHAEPHGIEGTRQILRLKRPEPSHYVDGALQRLAEKPLVVQTQPRYLGYRHSLIAR